MFNVPRLWIFEVNEQQVKYKFCQYILKTKLRTLVARGKASKHVKISDPLKSNGQKTLKFSQGIYDFKIKEVELLEFLYVEVRA